MKFENSWRYKTLENLEQDYRAKPAYGSPLVTRCQELRTIPLDQFTTEDLRIMISQEIGLEYLLPLAIEVLTIDLFAEGDFFEGDLLKSIFTIQTDFWNTHESYRVAIDNLIRDRRTEITARRFDTTNFDKGSGD